MGNERKNLELREKKYIRIIIGGLVILFAILGTILIAISTNDGRVSYFDVAVAVLALQPLSIFSFLIQAPRLALISGKPVSVMSALIANSVSSALFTVLPGRSSELLKPLVLNIRDGIPIARGLSALVAERLLDIGCVLFLFCIALAGNVTRFLPGLAESAIFPALVLAVAASFMLAVSVRPDLFSHLIGVLPSAWLRRQSEEALASMQRLGTMRALALPILFTIVTWAASFGNVIFVSHLLGETPLDPSRALVVMLAGTLGMVVTIAPGGFGTFEASIVAALTAYDYSVADGLVVALVLRVSMLLPALPVAVWYLAHGGMELIRRALEWRAEDRNQ